MSPPLTPRRGLSSLIGQSVREEIAGAIEALAVAQPDDTAVHEARKRIKRVRAVLRLLQPELGKSYELAMASLRQAAHALATQREADANLETLEYLGHRSRVLDRRTLGSVRRGLLPDSERAKRTAAQSIAVARRGLRSLAAIIERPIRQAGKWRAVRKGLVRGYRRARNAMSELDSRSSSTAFHRWRRRVKDHWYQLRLFKRLDGISGRRLSQLGEIEESVGNEHNLAILGELLLADPGQYGRSRDVALVLGCILREQRVLRERALSIGRRLFRPDARDFGDRLKRTKGAGG